MQRILLGGLICLLALTGVASAEPTPTPQTVTSDEAIGATATEIGRGHLDIGPRIVDGEWRFLGRDDTVSPPVWRHLRDLVVRVNDNAVLKVPDDPQYSFLPRGKQVHVVPQTQDQRVVWVGWTTQDPAVVEQLDRGGFLVLTGVQGPGRVVTFVANGFDAPTVLWDSTAAGEQKFWVNTNTHTHINWTFESPGHYDVNVLFRATMKSGAAIDVPAKITFLVGDKAVREKRDEAAEPAVAAPPPAADNRLWLWIAIGALAAIVVAGVVVRVVRSSMLAKEARRDGH